MSVRIVYPLHKHSPKAAWTMTSDIRWVTCAKSARYVHSGVASRGQPDSGLMGGLLGIRPYGGSSCGELDFLVRPATAVSPCTLGGPALHPFHASNVKVEKKPRCLKLGHLEVGARSMGQSRVNQAAPRIAAITLEIAKPGLTSPRPPSRYITTW